MENRKTNDDEALLRSLESEEWVSVDDLDSAIAEAQDHAAATLRKDRRMNIRISERDMVGLKAKAAEEGIPYQTLVTMVLHKYVTNRLYDRDELIKTLKVAKKEGEL